MMAEESEKRALKAAKKQVRSSPLVLLKACTPVKMCDERAHARKDPV